MTQENPPLLLLLFKKNKKKAAKEQLQEKGNRQRKEKHFCCCCLSQRGLFFFYILSPPLFFMSYKDWNPASPFTFQLYWLWHKLTRQEKTPHTTTLKPDEFLSVLWININFPTELHQLYSSLFSKRPTWTFFFFLNFNTIHGYIRESVFMYVYIYLCVI